MPAQPSAPPSARVLRCGVCGAEKRKDCSLFAYRAKPIRVGYGKSSAKVDDGYHVACSVCWDLIEKGHAATLADRAAEADRRDGQPTSLGFHTAVFASLVDRVYWAARVKS